ncbi:MAG: UvrD-helicase domain-containing protein [Candidatus Paceibacterota bacterium]|jgi:DNA helicase-2/ATP-dependent DNA helicase PcrA
MFYLNELNTPQREAVEHKNGPLLVIAGAGAGKTRTVAYRILHLVKSGVSPDQILAITFTNKAAREMKERILALFIKSNQNKIELSQDLKRSEPFVSTFHALCVYILRNEHRALDLPKFFSIFDRNDSISKIKSAMKKVGVDPKRFEPNKILSAISRQKGDGVSLNEYQTNAANYYSKTVSIVWTEYTKLLKKENALDFDDLLVWVVQLFKTQPEILNKYQERFSYISVDEYQDTNVIQYELVNLLAEKYKNICVVGDMDQSIYGWRGADYTNLLRFEKDYPSAKTVLLEENYRSTETILTAANRIIAKNTHRFDKNLFTKKKGGAKIGLYTGLEESDEANFIAERAREMIKEGTNPEQIAILYRANFQSRVLEEAFLRAGVIYQVLGTRFFERKEIKDIISYIKVALNPTDFEAMRRVINVPPRGLGQVTLTKIANGAEETLPTATKEKIAKFRQLLTEIANFAQSHKPSELIKFVLEKTKLEEELKKGGEDNLERLENAREFASLAVKYDHLASDEAVPIMLAEIMLTSEQDSLNQNKNGAKLMTVHAAKGLEFDTVFVTGLEEGLFPHQGFGETDRDEEEERRLFYVAITRARQKLYLTYAQSRLVFGSRQVNLPSEFIFDIDEELLETENGLWTII